MPVFDEEPVAQQPDPVSVQPKAFKGVTVDTKKTPRSTLTTFLEGQSWVVDYYSQVLGADNGTQGLQLDLNAVYQQYKLVRGMEFKVSSPLSAQQSDSKNEMSLSGSANVYGVLIPNVGDMFIADVGDGQEGLFQVSAARQKTIYADTAHEIDYKLVGYNTAEIYANLQEKTVETLFFNRDFLRKGYNPMVHVDTVNLSRSLEGHFARLSSLYFNDFYSREHNTLLVPNQDKPTYDPFLVKFILNIVTNQDHPAVRTINVLNVYNDQTMYELTLWNCLEAMDFRMLTMVANEMAILPVDFFKTMPMFNSIYYSRVKSVIYPTQYPTNVDAGYKDAPQRTTTPIRPGEHRFRELKRQVGDIELITDTAAGPLTDPAAPLSIKPVTQDSHYVFTEDFYKYDATEGNLSVLENLTRKALLGQPIDLAVLDKLCFEAPSWNNLDRFYYIPILFVLLKVYPRGL